MLLPRVEAHETVQQAFDIIEAAWPAEDTYRGEGDPNGNVTGGPGAEYVDLTTGRRWTHEVPSRSNVGWVLK